MTPPQGSALARGMKAMVSRVARHRKALTPMPVWAAAAAFVALSMPITSPTVGPNGRSDEQPLSRTPEAMRANVAPRTTTTEKLHSIETYGGPAPPTRWRARTWVAAAARLYNTAKRGDDKAKTR